MVESFANEECEGCVGYRDLPVCLYKGKWYVENHVKFGMSGEGWFEWGLLRDISTCRKTWLCLPIIQNHRPTCVFVENHYAPPLSLPEGPIEVKDAMKINSYEDHCLEASSHGFAYQ